MHAKPLFLAAALVALSATTASAQTAADQSAPMQDAAPTSSASPDTTSQPAQPNAATPASPTVPATAADLQPKAMVYDATGAMVGTIESVTSTGAVVSTGTARAQIPAASFAKNAQGLVIGMTKAQLEAAVAKATPAKS